MATYIILANFTEKGATNVRESVTTFRQRLEGAGATVKDLYMTQGIYDLVALAEGEELPVMTGLIRVAGDAVVRTATLRAFSPAEMEAVFARIG
jgi:uncharacterized protein with GYD domain